MRRVQAILRPTDTHLSIEMPEGRRERMRGLLGRDGLPNGHAMLLERTRLVHTVGMRFPISVVLLDARFSVLEVRRVDPGRLLRPRRGVRHVFECRTDEDVRVGDRLVLADPPT